MKIVRQYQIYLENKPGSLEQLATRLAERGLNLLSIIGFTESGGGGSLRICVEDAKLASSVFASLNMRVRESEVLLVPTQHKSGAVLELLQKLSAAGIQVESVYGIAPPDGRASSVILSVQDPRQALKILGGTL